MDHFDKLETERWLVRSDPRHIRVLHMVYRQFIQRSLDSYITMQNRKRLAQPKVLLISISMLNDSLLLCYCNWLEPLCTWWKT